VKLDLSAMSVDSCTLGVTPQPGPTTDRPNDAAIGRSIRAAL
jgi:hypothetical protein